MLDVLYEDNHLLAVLKPVGLATMGVAGDRPSLLSQAKSYIKQKYAKPGNVYLGIVSRLDAPVSGVVLIARTSKAAARLSRQFRQREVEKLYWAVVGQPIQPPSATLTDWLRKDERHRKVHVCGPTMPDAREARLTYRQIAVLPRGVLLEVLLETGRKHQIRVQLAHHGDPIVGDRKYGGDTALFSTGIGLHSRRLTLKHPIGGAEFQLTAPIPAAWKKLGVRG